MKKLQIFLLLFFLIKLQILPLVASLPIIDSVYAQDGGDGIGGAGNGDSGVSGDISPSNDNGGGTDTGDAGQTAPSSGGGTQQASGEGGTPTADDSGGGSASPTTGGNEPITQEQVTAQNEKAHAAWDVLQSTDAGIDPVGYQAALTDYLGQIGYAQSLNEQFDSQQKGVQTAEEQRDGVTESLNNGTSAQNASSGTRADVWAAGYANSDQAKGNPDAVKDAVEAYTASHPNATADEKAGIASIVSRSLGATDQEQAEAASQYGGFAAYTATINSSSMSPEDKAKAIENNASTITDRELGAALNGTGFSREEIEQRYSGYANIADIMAGFDSAKTTGATAVGVPVPGTTTAAPGAPTTVAAPAGGGTTASGPTASNSAGSSEASKIAVQEAINANTTPGSTTITQAQLNNIVNTAISSGMNSTDLGRTLSTLNGFESKDIKSAIDSAVNDKGITFSNNNGTATLDNYKNNVVDSRKDPEHPSTTSSTTTPSTATAPSGGGSASTPANPASGSTTSAPSANDTPLAHNQFDQRPAPTVDTNKAEWSYLTSDNKSIGVSVANPSYTGTGSSFAAGNAGNITLSTGQQVPINASNIDSNVQAVQQLYNDVSSGGTPTPQQLHNVTGLPASTFGGK